MAYSEDLITLGADMFERLHPNKKYAFLDGFLCGLVVAKLAYDFYQDFEEDRLRRKRAADSLQNDPSQ